MNIHSVMWAAFSAGGLITWSWVGIRIYFYLHLHPCGGPVRTPSSVQVYTRNNVRASEQSFMKFGTGEHWKIVELLQFSFRYAGDCSNHLTRRPACVPAHNPSITFWVFVGAQYVSNESCIVEWNLHFMAISFFVCFTLFKIKKSNVVNTYP